MFILETQPNSYSPYTLESSVRLKVRDFSCLQHIELKVRPVTVVIGEQGSGKSVLYKLLYFMLDQLRVMSASNLIISAEEDIYLSVKEEFYNWFPVEAWGNNKFEITLNLGTEFLQLNRQDQDQLKVTLSPSLVHAFKKIRTNLDNVLGWMSVRDGTLPPNTIQSLVQQEMTRLLGRFWVRDQLYVPSGRAFFTSVGKASVFFNPETRLDPITRRFAQLYFSSLDELRKNKDISIKNPLFLELMGGQFHHVNNEDYIVAADGRHLNISILSSGQQEALPLLSILSGYEKNYPSVKIGGPRARLLFVEELEAHLFPKAQGALLEEMVNKQNVLNNDYLYLLLSTHSPYVLSKLNNLIYAGQLSKQYPEQVERVCSIVANNKQIDPTNVAAYALKDGKLLPIMDYDLGLIDGEYLDDFSNDIDEEFSRLLEVIPHAD